MAVNPYYNKIIKNGTTLLDLTGDSVAPADVASGKTFHDASGAPQVGTASGGGGGFDWSQIQQCRIGSPVSGSNTINLAGLDTSTFTSMALMFYGCGASYLTGLTGLDTSHVTNFNQMFSGCKQLQSADCSGFDTSAATQIQGMFYDCNNINTITFGDDFDTSRVTNMINMFYGCQSLTSLTLGSAFDSSAAQDMSYFFYNCKRLDVTQIAPLLDVSANKTFFNMFYGCFDNSLYPSGNGTDLDLSTWDTRQATKMHQMFYGCKKMTSLTVKGTNWNTSNVTQMNNMFYECSGLTHLDLSDFDTSKVTSFGNMFYGCHNLQDVYMPQLDTSKVSYYSNISGMFTSCASLTDIIWSQKNTVQPIAATPAQMGITSSSKKFYVPDALVTDYKAATNWSMIADQIYGISDLPQAVKTRYGIQ